MSAVASFVSKIFIIGDDEAQSLLNRIGKVTDPNPRRKKVTESLQKLRATVNTKSKSPDDARQTVLRRFQMRYTIQVINEP
jgi:hypothetical protein